MCETKYFEEPNKCRKTIITIKISFNKKYDGIANSVLTYHTLFLLGYCPLPYGLTTLGYLCSVILLLVWLQVTSSIWLCALLAFEMKKNTFFSSTKYKFGVWPKTDQ